MKKLFSVLIVIGVIVALIYGALAVLVPPILQSQIEKMIAQHGGQQVIVGNVSVSLSGPKIILNNVTVMNPPGFPDQPAIEIGEIVLSGEGYDLDPVKFHAIEAHNIKSHLFAMNGVDNFGVLQSALEVNLQKLPLGFMTRSTIIRSVSTHNNTIESGLDSKSAIVIPNGINTNIGTDAVPVTLQQGLTQVALLIVQKQREGVTPLAVRNLANKAKDTVERIGGAINEFLKE